MRIVCRGRPSRWNHPAGLDRPDAFSRSVTLRRALPGPPFHFGIAGAGSGVTVFPRWPSRLDRWLLPLSRPVHVRLEAAALAACVLSSLCLIANLLLFQSGRDQGIYAVVARTMLDGGVPYRDAWDFKPPGISFGYAAARMLFGRAMYGIGILEAMGLLSLLPALILLSRRCVGDWRGRKRNERGICVSENPPPCARTLAGGRRGMEHLPLAGGLWACSTS
jgi:hypothetical protein